MHNYHQTTEVRDGQKAKSYFYTCSDKVRVTSIVSLVNLYSLITMKT